MGNNTEHEIPVLLHCKLLLTPTGPKPQQQRHIQVCLWSEGPSKWPPGGSSEFLHPIIKTWQTFYRLTVKIKWFAFFLSKHKLLYENTWNRFSRSPRTFSFKALVNRVSSSATVKCASSLVSVGRLWPHVGDFSLDTQRVEVYKNFMILTKPSAFWKSSSVSLSSLGEKKRCEDKNKISTYVLTHCFTSRWSSDDGCLLLQKSPPSGKGSSTLLWHPESCCVVEDLKHTFILNYNLLKMFETSLKHEISKATLLTEKLMLLPQDGLSHGGPLQPHHNSSRSGSPLCNGTDAVNLLGCQVMGWAKHSTFKSFTVSSATSILLALSTVAAATFVFIWNFSRMQFISSSTMRPVCDSYTAVLSAECSVVHRNC